ncbi:MAG: hypothetical protein DRH33_06695 [Candidatus Nealsonbacteria bacterium]|nr:MAG: hypothetical protein DRH33_06695 [Candidatus Nealsonbacteria bacterium]
MGIIFPGFNFFTTFFKVAISACPLV